MRNPPTPREEETAEPKSWRGCRQKQERGVGHELQKRETGQIPLPSISYSTLNLDKIHFFSLPLRNPQLHDDLLPVITSDRLLFPRHIAEPIETSPVGKKRRAVSGAGGGDGSGAGRKRKSRWAEDDPLPVIQLPDFMKDFTTDLDPDVQTLNILLLEIIRKLQSGLPLDDRPECARSPSPESIYDNLRIRINTWEYRAREKLMKERQEIISKLIQKNPTFRPPADYRPP
ncbi:hypothetical protein KSP40_PGU002860 [Platanthera guangdongensis]|uniref:Splicing factor 1 helix-hairpin domain-containing protein n=1 Tax=Platanthera guangdongensis TaxID=2320717 RepID=A0ABR2MDF5_9ASPA